MSINEMWIEEQKGIFVLDDEKYKKENGFKRKLEKISERNNFLKDLNENSIVWRYLNKKNKND